MIVSVIHINIFLGWSFRFIVFFILLFLWFFIKSCIHTCSHSHSHSKCFLFPNWWYKCLRSCLFWLFLLFDCISIIINININISILLFLTHCPFRIIIIICICRLLFSILLSFFSKCYRFVILLIAFLIIIRWTSTRLITFFTNCKSTKWWSRSWSSNRLCGRNSINWFECPLTGITVLCLSHKLVLVLLFSSVLFS